MATEPACGRTSFYTSFMKVQFRLIMTMILDIKSNRTKPDDSFEKVKVSEYLIRDLEADSLNGPNSKEKLTTKGFSFGVDLSDNWIAQLGHLHVVSHTCM